MPAISADEIKVNLALYSFHSLPPCAFFLERGKEGEFQREREREREREGGSESIERCDGVHPDRRSVEIRFTV